MAAAILLVSFVVLLLIGIPVAVSIGIACLVYVVSFMDMSPLLIIQQMIGGINKFSLLAVPFFMLAGAFMESGGISRRLVRFVNSIFGSFPGGLALVMVFASMLFAAMTGSGVATCAAVGGIMFPIMKQEKYGDDFTCALQASSGILGPIIPPSILMVVYGVATNLSVSDLLMAGLIPGVFLTLLFGGIAVYLSWKNGWRGVGKFSWRELGSSFKEAIWALLVPVIILGGIYSGFCTPTESAAVAALYSLLVGTFVYKEITIKKMFEVVVTSFKQMGGLLLIVAVGSAFAWILTRERIPNMIAEWMISISSNRYVFMGFAALLILFTGCFLDCMPSILILAPILSPVAVQYGIDPIHFAVFCVVGTCIGLITPPVGANLFVVSAMTERPLQRFIPKVLPFLIVSLIGFVIIGLVPQISTFLPNLLH